MATAIGVRSTPSSVQSEATPSSAVSPATSVEDLNNTKQDIYTINELLQRKAKAETCNEPIVAYPSEGTDYTYYTPKQVSFLL